MRWQTPSIDYQKKETISLVQLKKVKDICRKINWMENLKSFEKPIPSSTKNHKKVIIVNISNPNEWERASQKSPNSKVEEL